jgi:predicted TPR repeat methyltransferase
MEDHFSGAASLARLRVMGKTVPDRATTQAPVDALFDQFTK